MIAPLGRLTIQSIASLGELALFFGTALFKFLIQRRRLAKMTAAIEEIGVRCLPIVTIVGLFTGLVMGLQLYYTLVKFGATSALGTAVALSIIRELGPVLTALMIVGQAGSALSSELGIQRNGEQIDALSTLGIDPRGFLVGPRLLAGLICFPILTAIFDLIGIFGGYISGSLLLNVDSGVYWNSVLSSVVWADVSNSILKAVCFGLLTMAICTYFGFFAHQRSRYAGVRGVTDSATKSVVWSSIAILASDYIVTSLLL